MKIDVNIVSIHGVQPSASGIHEFQDGLSITKLMALLDLPVEDTYAVMINDRPVPPSLREEHIMMDNDKITIFPPIKGG